MSKNIEISRVMTVFKIDFLKRFKANLIWIAATVALMFLYLLLYPTMEELILEKLDAMPEEFLSLLGTDSALGITDFTSYFGIIFGVFAIVYSIYASLLGSNVIYEEERTGTIEFLNAQEISRTEIYLGKLINLLLNVLIIMIFAYLAIIISGYSVDPENFSGVDIFKVVGLNLVVFLFFGSIGLFLSTILNKKIKPSSITIGIFFGTYLIGYLGNLMEDSFPFLQYVSPIYITNASTILNSSLCGGTEFYNPTGIIVISVITVCLLVFGGFTYNRKNIH